MPTQSKYDSRRVNHKTLLLLFFLAFIVRSAYALWGLGWAGDSTAYLALAKNLAFHHSFSLITGIPTAWHPPLYPFLIAALWWSDNPPITALILLQIICGAATVVLVYLIAQDRFHHTVALVAALGMTFAPMSVHYTTLILTESVFTLLLILAIFFWGRSRAIAAGLAFGLAALTRTTIIPFLLCLPLLLVLPPWRQYKRLYLIIFIVAISVSSVWTIRNAIVFRKFILVQSGGLGVNLFAGTIETQLYGDEVWTKVINELKANEDNFQGEVERDRGYLLKAVERMTSDPMHYLKVRFKQYPRLFLDSGDYLLGRHNVTFTEALREPRPVVIITKVGFVLGNLTIFLLAIYGIFVERRRFISLSHMILFPICLTLIHLPLWIESRYSLPMMPLVLILAAVGIVRLTGSTGEQRSSFKDAPKRSLSNSLWMP